MDGGARIVIRYQKMIGSDDGNIFVPQFFFLLAVVFSNQINLLNAS